MLIDREIIGEIKFDPRKEFLLVNLFYCFFIILVAKRRLNNFDKKGLDRFGRSKMLVPLTRWQSFKNRVIGLKDHAKVYEDAYNDIKASLENKKSVREILDALPLSAQEQVRNEKERLIVAKSISITEKNAYVRVRLFCW